MWGDEGFEGTVGRKQYESRRDENMREEMRGQDKEIGLHIRQRNIVKCIEVEK